MAKEIRGKYSTGANLYAVIYNAAGQVWNGTTFGAWADGSYATYPVALTELGASGLYAADFPAAIVTAGYYDWLVYARQGGSPAITDRDYNVSAGQTKWNGTAAATPATDLDAIAPSTLTGLASTWPEKLDALWRWFYKKNVLTGTGTGSGTIVTYANDGTTVLTTSAVTETSTTQTKGAAT